VIESYKKKGHSKSNRFSLKMNNVELFVKFKNGRNRGNISEIRAKRASHQFIRKRREGGRAGGYWRER